MTSNDSISDLNVKIRYKYLEDSNLMMTSINKKSLEHNDRNDTA